MARFVRQGSCVRCGGCCGEDGINPWPRNFASNIRTWRYSDVYNLYGRLLTRVLGFVEGPDGNTVLSNEYGNIRVKGTTYRWLIRDGLGIVKVNAQNVPVGTECPLLTGTTANAVRPCALENLPDRKAEFAQDALQCFGYVNGNNPPPVFEDAPVPEGEEPPAESQAAADVAGWFAIHPQCSYTYVQE